MKESANHISAPAAAAHHIEESERLKHKQDNEARAYDTGLKKLVSVMNRKNRPGWAGTCEDPLLQACILVGQASGIVIKPHMGEIDEKTDELDAITRTSGIRKRLVALKGKWWTKDNGPMLGYTDKEKKPLALIADTPGRYRMINPETGENRRINEATSEMIHPFAVVFYRSLPATPLKGMDLVRFTVFGKSKEFITLVCMGILGALLGLVTPIVTGMIFDEVIPEASRYHMFQIGYILFSCAVASTVFEITKGVAALRLEGRVDADLQGAVMDRLMLLSPSFFKQFTAGDLAERTMGINAIRQILSSTVITSVLSFVFSVFYFLLLFRYSFKLAMVAFGLTIISIIMTMGVAFLQVRNQRSMAGISGEISGMLLQFITGISKLRITGTENRAFIKWTEAFSRQESISYKSGVLSNIMAAFNAGFPILASMAIFFSVFAIKQEGFSTGDFLSFNAAYGSFQNAMLQMSMTAITIMSIVPLYERAKPILESMPEADEAKRNPGKLKGDIEVSHLNFRYTEDGPFVINDLSLRIRAGEFVAVVGSSGSGKSTFFRLLVGFEKQESGAVYYDGQDLGTLDVREVRRQIGVVLQHSHIMPGDIYKNIIGASARLTLDDAWEAARLAGLDNDIKSMPMGMHTMLQAGGGTISGGQKQRLMIARAIVHKPGIIYFDEATSALDNQTQALVIKSLEQLKATRVMIAHRLSTIVNADTIVVMDKGRIVQKGTYGELIRQPGIFAELAKRQVA